MSATPKPATVNISVRVPIGLLATLDELCRLTERTRTYWITHALEETLTYELEEARAVAEALTELETNPAAGIPDDQIDEYLIAQGLTTREALDRAAARHGRTGHEGGL